MLPHPYVGMIGVKLSKHLVMVILVEEYVKWQSRAFIRKSQHFLFLKPSPNMQFSTSILLASKHVDFINGSDREAPDTRPSLFKRGQNWCRIVSLILNANHCVPMLFFLEFTFLQCHSQFSSGIVKLSSCNCKRTFGGIFSRAQNFEFCCVASFNCHTRKTFNPSDISKWVL